MRNITYEDEAELEEIMFSSSPHCLTLYMIILPLKLR